MFRKLRFWLARLLLGSNFDMLCDMTAYSAVYAFDKFCWMNPDTRSLTWEIRDYNIRIIPHTRFCVQCNICTGVFDADPDAICKCPYCGSIDCQLVEANQT